METKRKIGIVLFLVTYLISNKMVESRWQLVEKFIGSAGTLFGGYSRVKAVSEAYAQITEGEDARESLNQALLTLILVDVGYFIPVSTKDIFENLIKSKAFKETKKAVQLYNKEIISKAKEAARYHRLPVKAGGKRLTYSQTYKKVTKLQTKISQLEKAKISVFKTEIKSLKVTNPALYKRMGKVSKWLKVGKTGAKALGPLLDVISIGLNAWSLATSKPGTAAHTSAAVGLAAGIIGTAGFLIALAVGIPVIGTVAAILGAILGIASTFIGLIGDPEPTITEVSQQKIENTILPIKEIMVDKKPFDISKILNNTKTTQWRYAYVMNQANLVKWNAKSRGSTEYILPEDSTKEFIENMKFGYNVFIPRFTYGKVIKYNYYGNSHLYDSHKYDYDHLQMIDPHIPNAYTFSPYLPRYPSTSLQTWTKKGSLNVNGLLRKTKWETNQQSLGFDFIARGRNHFSDDPKFSGLVVICQTNLIQNVEENYRGLDIQTELPLAGLLVSNAHDVVLIGDMLKLEAGKFINVYTGGGDDVFSVKGRLHGKKSVKWPKEPEETYSNELRADLGSGNNILSFTTLKIKKDEIMLPDYNFPVVIKFRGITFRISNGSLGYLYWNCNYRMCYPAVHWIGYVRGVKLFESCPSYNEIILDLPNEPNSQGIEDFGVVNHVGENVYILNVPTFNRFGSVYTRVYLITDSSPHNPVIKVYMAHYRITRFNLKGNRVLIIYGRRFNNIRPIYARIKLNNLNDDFTLKVNNKVIDLDRLSVSYHNGNFFKVSVSGSNMDSFNPSNKNDQVMLHCNNRNDLKNGKNIDISLLDGKKDTVVISTRYLVEPCDIETESDLGDDSTEDAGRTSMTMDFTGGNSVIVFRTDGIEKRLQLRGVERVCNDMGTTIFDLTQKNTGQHDLFQKFKDSMQKDLSHLGANGPFFGGTSYFVLQEEKRDDIAFFFEVLFKPKKRGRMIFFAGYRKFIYLRILQNGKLRFSISDTQIFTTKERILLNGWNKVSINGVKKKIKIVLNDKPQTFKWENPKKYYRYIHIGYKEKFKRMESVKTGLPVGFIGFIGDISKFMYNGKYFTLQAGTPDVKKSYRIGENPLEKLNEENSIYFYGTASLPLTHIDPYKKAFYYLLIRLKPERNGRLIFFAGDKNQFLYLAILKNGRLKLSMDDTQSITTTATIQLDEWNNLNVLVSYSMITVSLNTVSVQNNWKSNNKFYKKIYLGYNEDFNRKMASNPAINSNKGFSGEILYFYYNDEEFNMNKAVEKMSRRSRRGSTLK